MPELPEVETIARKLRPHLEGRAFVEAQILWERTVAQPDALTFCRALIGARVNSVGRRGKFLLFGMASDQTWLVHLRMTGKFFVHPAGESAPDDPHTRAVFCLDDDTRLVYVDQRKFGRFHLVDDPVEVIGKLGPEPLAPEFTAAWLGMHLQGRKTEVKRLLLDQRFIAGLGNIYVSEALWRARIHPLRAANTLSDAEAARLHTAIVAVLEEGIGNGGTSLQDRQYVYPDGNLGQQQRYLAVYDRAAERCPRCGYAIERIVQAQRSTFFCPICQPLAEQ